MGDFGAVALGRATIGDEVRGVRGPGERRVHHQRGAAYTGECAHARLKLAHESGNLLVAVVRTIECDRPDPDTLRIEAGVDAAHLHETAHEQSGTHRHEECERNLADDEDFAPPFRANALHCRATAILERLRWIAVPGPQRG